MIRKYKQKIVKDFMFNEKHRVNVVNITEDGKNSKFYNVNSPFYINFKTKNRSRYIDIKDRNFKSTEEAKIALSQLNEIIGELNELKEVYEFIVNQCDVNFEREEKLKRIID